MIRRLPNGMQIPSLASVVAHLTPHNSSLPTRYGELRCAVSRHNHAYSRRAEINPLLTVPLQ
jgi:hypothetical protein